MSASNGPGRTRTVTATCTARDVTRTPLAAWGPFSARPFAQIRYLEVFSEARSAQHFGRPWPSHCCFAACELSPSSIDERWRQAFEDQYAVQSGHHIRM